MTEKGNHSQQEQCYNSPCTSRILDIHVLNRIYLAFLAIVGSKIRAFFGKCDDHIFDTHFYKFLCRGLSSSGSG